VAPAPKAPDTLALYERQADAFDANRDRSLFERVWLDRFAAYLDRGAPIIDLGCGVGEPIAAHFIRLGFDVTGIDGASAMIDKCIARFPGQEWIMADMRGLRLDRQFAGIIAWNSFFHLTRPEQEAMFPVFSALARPGAPLLFTTGPTESEAWGQVGDEPVYHASLSPRAYRRLMDETGWSVVDHRKKDPDCAGHTVWLAQKRV